MSEDNKHEIDFNEALRRIANTPKDFIEPSKKPTSESKDTKKAAPSTKGAAKVN